MSFLMNVLEHSKKVGRILALLIILGVAGTISIMIAAANIAAGDINAAKDLVKDWLGLGGIAITFYFLTAPKKP